MNINSIFTKWKSLQEEIFEIQYDIQNYMIDISYVYERPDEHLKKLWALESSLEKSCENLILPLIELCPTPKNRTDRFRYGEGSVIIDGIRVYYDWLLDEANLLKKINVVQMEKI